MKFFPTEEVDRITHGFNTFLMYFGFELLVCLILFYTAREARLLGMLCERGPLGMGVYYGLDQFDEVLNHEAIQKRKEPKSRFVDDANLPWPTIMADAEAAPLPFHVGHNYGAFEGKSMKLSSGPSKNVEHWQERWQHAEEEEDNAGKTLEDAEKGLAEAENEAANEKDAEKKEEMEAIGNFREQEMKTEKHQEKRAEEFAIYDAEQAAKEAENDGASPMEIQRAYMMTYQNKMRKYHRTMLEMAKAQTLHQHYRHAEREKHYHEMEEEAAQKIEEARTDLTGAQRRLERAKAAKQSLLVEKESLVAQGLWKEPGAEGADAEVENNEAWFFADSAPPPVELDQVAAPAELEQGVTSYPPPPATLNQVGGTMLLAPPSMGPNVVGTASMAPVMTTGNFGGQPVRSTLLMPSMGPPRS